MKQVGLFLLCWSMLLACNNNNIQQRNQVLGLRQMSDLATAEYIITKIIRANDNKTWYKWGDRKILMSCRASVKAGIDLSQLKAEDFQITGKKITLLLPPAKLISLNIPPENINIEYEEVGLFRSTFKTGERDALAAQAEAQIRNSADSLGILTTAKENAELFIRSFLMRAGYKEVVFSSNSPTTPALN